MRSLAVSFVFAIYPALVSSAAIWRRTDPTPLSSAQINTFTPYSFFASAGYCNPSVTKTWTCGANCNNLAGFIPTASGGDGDDVQFWYVGFFPPLNTVIVAHQGTDPSELEPLLTDAEIAMSTLDSTLFPGISSSIQVHDGFQDAQADTASAILAAVQQTMSAHNTKTVTLASHSLGAAISLLDAMFLQLHLPSTTSFKIVNYGMPRVGNQAFASYMDSHFSDLTHINNQEDPIPILPGRFLGYVHPHGEVHIQDSNAWVSCAGDDDTATGCEIASVPNIFDGDLSDHDGPYNGVTMGC